MSTTEIMDGIRALPPSERVRLARFLQDLESGPKLNPTELADLAQQYADEPDPAKMEELKERFIRGFRGI